MTISPGDAREGAAAAKSVAPVILFGLPSYAEVLGEKRRIARATLETDAAYFDARRAGRWADLADLEQSTSRRPMLRTFVALQLARDVSTCAALLRDEPVDPDLLDQDQLFAMRLKQLVRLDLHAIDLLELEHA